MKVLLFGACLVLSTFAVANCQYSYQKDQSKLTWTAFKTPKKVGVQGSFATFEIISKTAKTSEEVLKGATFNIDASTVSTGNPDRDKKIANFFFSTLKGGATIKGKVLSVKKDKVAVALTINEKTNETVFDLLVDGDKIQLKSSIDVLKFGLDSQLAALNEACKALHEGKTWSDVDLNLEATLSKKCE